MLFSIFSIFHKSIFYKSFLGKCSNSSVVHMYKQAQASDIFNSMFSSVFTDLARCDVSKSGK